MGIKFLCPNGHKLNVKSFLGGKRAICPKCGARVVVPTQGQPAAPQGLQEETVDRGGLSESVHAEAAALAPQVTSEGFVSAPATPLTLDPFAEAPSAVWYVRPATGGQFGPASADIMRCWLQEGRVGASSLVWRAGWSEWRAAAAIFPQLAGLLASPGVSVGPPRLVPPAPSTSSASRGNGTPPPLGTSLPPGEIVQSGGLGDDDLGPLAPPPVPGVRRRRRRDKSIFASGILVLVVIVLLVILFIVLRPQYAPEEAIPSDTSPPTAGP